MKYCDDILLPSSQLAVHVNMKKIFFKKTEPKSVEIINSVKISNLSHTFVYLKTITAISGNGMSTFCELHFLGLFDWGCTKLQFFSLSQNLNAIELTGYQNEKYATDPFLMKTELRAHPDKT